VLRVIFKASDGPRCYLQPEHTQAHPQDLKKGTDMKIIEVVYLVLYILAAVCFLVAGMRRRPPGTTANWDLIGAGLFLVVLVKIIALIDANS